MNQGFGLNPIIVKELRSRMRGGRAFLILTGMLVLLGGALYGLYRIMLANMFYSSTLSAAIGQTLFSGLALLLLAIICFITPAVTAGALSSEREKLTYEMLLTTPLRPGSILWGKLIAALSYVFLLIFAAVPLASLVFIFGGVALKEMFKTLIVLVTVAVMLGVTGIFFSAWLGRTARATVMSYLFVLLLVVGPLVAYIAAGTIQQQVPSRWLLIPNPLSALFSAMMPSLAPNNGGGVVMSLGMALSGDLGRITGMDTRVVRPLYHYSLPFFAALTLLLYGLAAQQIQPIRRWRLRRSSVVTATLAVVLVGGGTFVAFQQTAGQYEGGIFSPLPTPAPFNGAPAPMAVRAVAQRVERGPVISPLPTSPTLVDGLYAVDEAVEIYACGGGTLPRRYGPDRRIQSTRCQVHRGCGWLCRCVCHGTARGQRNAAIAAFGTAEQVGWLDDVAGRSGARSTGGQRCPRPWQPAHGGQSERPGFGIDLPF